MPENQNETKPAETTSTETKIQPKSNGKVVGGVVLVVAAAVFLYGLKVNNWCSSFAAGFFPAKERTFYYNLSWFLLVTGLVLGIIGAVKFFKAQPASS